MYAVAVQTACGEVVAAQVDFARYAQAVADTVRALGQAVGGFPPLPAVPFDDFGFGSVVYIVGGGVLQGNFGLPALFFFDGCQITVGQCLHVGLQAGFGTLQFRRRFAVLFVFKQHDAQIETRIGQVGLLRQNAAIQCDGFVMAELGAAECAECVVVEDGVARGQGLVFLQQFCQARPVLFGQCAADLRFQGAAVVVGKDGGGWCGLGRRLGADGCFRLSVE